MNVRQELERVGCIYDGHFVGVSGKHLAGYCNIDPVLPHVSLMSAIAKEMVRPFAKDGIQTVVVPAVGAIPLSHWGAYHLKELSGKEVFGVWADKIGGGKFAFERSGFLKTVQGHKVLVLEDMINQMFSVKEIIKVVEKAGGEVAGVASIAANKGVSAVAMRVPKFIGLADVHYEAWEPEDCQKKGLCSKGTPIITDVGHGAEYQANHPDYIGGYTTLLS